MCMLVKNTEFEVYGCSDFLEKPLTGYLIHETLAFRNGYDDISCVADVARRVVAEVGFALLALAALVEGAVRVAFCLLAVIPALCCCGGDGFDAVVTTGAAAGAYLLDLFLRGFKGFLINFCYEHLDMEDLTICVLNPPPDNSLWNGV